MIEPMTFGIKEEGKDYIIRPAVYGVVFNKRKDKLAVIQTAEGHYFLPGGGIENNETHEACLKREAIEEMGTEIEIDHYIGCAQKYFYSLNENQYYMNVGHFYLCRIGKKIGSPLDTDYFLKWMDPVEVINVLVHEHQRWAVQESFKLNQDK